MKTKRIKFVCISDTHNKHGELVVPKGDILIHAGDFTRVGALKDVKSFNDFLGTLPHPHKIVIAGNHDFCFEKKPKEARALLSNCIYLQDESVEIEGLNIYGSPWQPTFFNWAFNLQRGEQIRKKWNLIPENTHVLITHGPPFGHGDKTLRGEPVGCMDLLRTIEKIKPKCHIFGHIHEDPGVTFNKDTAFVNASSCNVEYHMVNPPIVFDYEISEED